MKCADPIRADIERARRQLGRGADPARVLDELSRRLTNKLLHAPLRALNPGLQAERLAQPVYAD